LLIEEHVKVCEDIYPEKMLITLLLILLQLSLPELD